VTSTGTVSDFDRIGFFGLIVADEGDFLPFNVRDTPQPLRGRVAIGTRVRFERQASNSTARAVDVIPLESSSSGRAGASD
jgi:cold shock CspA family protein